MKKLHTLLGKFKKLTPPDRAVKNCCVEAVKNITDISIKDSAVSVQGSVVYLIVPSLLKSEVFLHKKEILFDINKNLESFKKITDIR